jgi:hypothetical protein
MGRMNQWGYSHKLKYQRILRMLRKINLYPN